MALTDELATYTANKDRLLADGEGEYVLICRNDVVGTYDTQADAINEGYRRFGNVPFLVKKVVRVEIPETFVSNLLAL